MTQLTIAFDEKFDLEEGELKYTEHDADYGNFGFSYASDINELAIIDNTNDVTILHIDNNSFNNIYSDYIQFGYFVDDELIKATKDIPLKYLGNHHTSGVPINISDVEKFLIYIDSDNDGLGAEDDNHFGINLYLRMITGLVGYDVENSDFDNYSGLIIKLTFYDGDNNNVHEKIISFDDMEYNGYYIMDTTNTNLDAEEYSQYSIKVEILNPNIVINDDIMLEDMS